MKLAAFVLLASLPLVAAPCSAEPPNPVDSERSTTRLGETGARIVEFVTRAEYAGFSGAVLAAKGGQVVAAVAIGYADLADEVPNTPATLFEIASATKQFTAAAVMRLVQEG